MSRPELFLRRVLSVVPLADRVVLDIGCGDGLRTKGIAAVSKRVVAVDPDAEAIAKAKKENRHQHIEYRRASALDLPFDNAAFDVVMFTMSFHHLEPKDMGHALTEALRVTKSGGYLAFLEPGWAGTLFEAEARFDFGDGDIRQVKGYAYHALLTERRMKEEAEFIDHGVYPYRSINDFIKDEHPNRGTRVEWQAFLRQHRYRLRADIRTHIFSKR